MPRNLRAFHDAFAGTFGPFGHDAVIVFFVLSGYVITFSAVNKDNSLGTYAISRAARIYSVAIPAILVTIVLDAIDISIDPGAYRPHYQFQELWFYIPFWSSFATDFWFLNEDMLSDGAFWSLSYEVWYYAVFAAFTYLSGRRRAFWAVAVLLLIGPRQWLLLPIWLLGSWLYKNGHKYPLPRTTARVLFCASIGAYALLKGTHSFDLINAGVNAALGGFPKAYLRYSQYFLGDYLIAMLVALNIYAARHSHFETLIKWARLIRWPASLTFTLYLFNKPLLIFFSVSLGLDADSVKDFLILLVSVVFAVVFIGTFTERKKWVLKRLLQRFAIKAEFALQYLHPT